MEQDDRLAKLNNGQINGLLGVCVDKRNVEKSETMDYWIGAEYAGKVPEEFSTLTIPASKWVVFEVHGPMPDAFKKLGSEFFPNGSLRAVMNMPELLNWKYTTMMMLQTLTITPKFGFRLKRDSIQPSNIFVIRLQGV